MSRPVVEVADILRAQGSRFLDKYQSSFGYQKLKAFRAIQNCRTAALGGHLDACSNCGQQAISYNSCRNRHCPKCQAQARQRWLAAREREVLPTTYFHVVFSVPHELNVFALENPRAFYDLLFQASAASALEMAANPERLGAEIGLIAILHTWGQNLTLHPHIHCVVPAGGLSPDHQHWIRAPNHFFLPVKVLSRVFRGKFVAGLRRAFRKNKLVFFGACRSLAQEKAFSAFLRTLFREDWVVYAKRPFGGPEHVLHYLARYNHRVAISNHRLVDVTDANVTFRWKELCSPQQASHHDVNSRGVLAAIPSARLAKRISSHPLLRLSRQSPAQRRSTAVPHVAGGPTSTSPGNAYCHANPLSLPSLSGTNADYRTLDRRSTPLEATTTGRIS